MQRSHAAILLLGALAASTHGAETVVRMTDISPGTGSSYPGFLTVSHKRLYFRASPSFNGGTTALWGFDGTNVSLIMNTYVQGLRDCDDVLYFDAYPPGEGSCVYRFDGTNLSRVTNDTSCNYSGPHAYRYIVYDGAIYYPADDGMTGVELWRDGPAGDGLVADINPGPGDSYPNSFAIFRGLMYFAADDGVHGAELFRYDGTAVSLVSNLNTNAVYEYDGEHFGHSNPSVLTVYRDALYFIAFGGVSRAIWRFDGTNAVALGGGMHGISELVELNGQLYFDGDDETWGRELWRVETNAEPRLTITRTAAMLNIHLHEAETGNFVLERSRDFQSWTPVTTNSTFGGRVAFTDNLAADVPQRIYRAVRAAPP